MVDFADALLFVFVLFAVKAAAQGAVLDFADTVYLLVPSVPHLLTHEAYFGF
jgi:hypothetical protein